MMEERYGDDDETCSVVSTSTTGSAPSTPSSAAGGMRKKKPKRNKPTNLILTHASDEQAAVSKQEISQEAIAQAKDTYVDEAVKMLVVIDNIINCHHGCHFDVIYLY